MPVSRTYAFVDGENLVMRYQAMVAEGYKPKPDVIHVPDTFVWHPGVTKWSCMDIQRVSYYTSATGDAKRIAELRTQIANVTYHFAHDTDPDTPEGMMQLVPKIFHKHSRSQKTRNVDINIVIDIMRAAHLPSAEMLFLLSGDGDYLPVVDEAMRLGKQVWVCSFSSGLNEQISTSVDLYETLDDIFFLPKESS